MNTIRGKRKIALTVTIDMDLLSELYKRCQAYGELSQYINKLLRDNIGIPNVEKIPTLEEFSAILDDVPKTVLPKPCKKDPQTKEEWEEYARERFGYTFPTRK